MGFNLGDMVNKIVGYDKILSDYNYICEGKDGNGGHKPWSILYLKENNSIEIRNSEWTFYEGEDEIKVGDSPESLKSFLESLENNTNWISVKDRLPEIPKGRHSVSVLVAMFDPTFNELNPGKGYAVTECIFGKVDGREFFEGKTGYDFMEMHIGINSSWGPTGDPVTHWMYLPKPPIIDEDK